jgi:serine/threonine-protein kinase
MSDMLQPGDVLDDSYEIVEFISKGGFGAVYRARQLSMDRDVALKLLIPGAQPDFEGLVKRFRGEVKAVRNLRHPNTVQIYDFHESNDGQLYFTMEYLEGRSLRDMLKNGEALSPKRTANILAQSLKSLAEAHSTGIIHRDIKPANIMLVDMYGEDDFVKVLDFGIAKAVEDGPTSGGDEPLTRTGYLVGTVRYMAPERIAGDPAGAYSDIYSLGLVGASLLVGRPLLGNSSRLEAMQIQMSAQPLPIPEPVRSTALGPILDRALQKSPKHRYQSAEQMLDDLLAVPDAALEDAAIHVSGEIPMSEALGAVSSSGIEPTTVDSEIQSGPARRPKRGRYEARAPREQEQVPTGWGEQAGRRADRSGSHSSPDQSGSRPVNRSSESASAQQRTEVFTPGNDAPPAQSDITPQPPDTPPPIQTAERRKDGADTTAKKKLGGDESNATSKLPLYAGLAVVLLALGGALTWFLLQDRNATGDQTDADQAAAANYFVDLRSNPTGAVVFEDGERLGATPIEVEPQQGRMLTLELDGYESKRIELGPDAPPSYTLELTRTEKGSADSPDDEPSESLTFDEPSESAQPGEADEPTDEPSSPEKEEAKPEPDAPAEPSRSRSARESEPDPKPESKPEPEPEPEEQEVIPVFETDDSSSSDSTPKQKEKEPTDEGSEDDIPVF